MLYALLKKDLKLIFLNKSNFGLVFLLPVFFILLLGFTMKDYIGGEYGTFDDGAVLYYNDGATDEMLERFDSIASQITDKTGVEFKEASDYDKAKKDVEKSEAFSVIRITADKFDYFRSSFNEPEGGDIIRSLFSELSDSSIQQDNAFVNVTLDVEKPDSAVYYTFTGLSLAIMIMGAVIAASYSKDRNSDTFNRIVLSKAGRVNIILSKILTGLVCGGLQVLISITVSTLVFGIKWKENFGLIILVFFVLVIFSTGIGSVVGMISNNDSVSMTIVEMVGMLSGYLGGAITPLYLLESRPVIKYIVKASPIYWTNQSLTSLYNGITDEKTTKCVVVLLSISAVLFILTGILSIKSSGKMTSKVGKGKKKLEEGAES